MATETQAYSDRDFAAEELKEAVRQAERYLRGEKQSIRIVKNRMDKVIKLEEELRLAHYSYCIKTKLELDCEEAKNYITKKSDEAIDCVDRCIIVIEDYENGDAEKAQNQLLETERNVLEEKFEKEFNALNIHVVADEKFALELCQKITSVLDTEEHTMEKMAVVKFYKERLDGVVENLNSSWSSLITLSSGDERVNVNAMNAARLNIQETLSFAEVFIQKCALEDEKLIRNPFTSAGAPFIAETLNISGRNNSLKTEKINLPTFSGNVRTFAKFCKDFKKIVEPAYPDVTQRIYVLKESCLKDNAKIYVENIEELDEVWERLNQKYGDKINLVDMIIKDLEGVLPLKGNDDTRFIAMVDLLEKGLQDLQAIDARHEIANAYSVKLIESKLSRAIYLSWLKEEETIDGTSRFEKLFNFLKSERRRVEKLVQRNPKDDRRGQYKKDNPKEMSYGLQDVYTSCVENKTSKHNCLLHPNASHFTRKCRTFLGKSPEQRAAVLKTTKGCEFCLSTSHAGKPCPWTLKWGPCKIDNCGKYHSHLLHEADKKSLIQNTYYSEINCTLSHDSTIKRNTLLLVQHITTVYGQIRAFFDSGSTISLVSRSFVKRHKLKGVPVKFELVTVGGESRTQNTFLHNIVLLDVNGGKHIVKAFEIEEICGQINSIDVSDVISLFSDVSVHDVQRQPGHVELLVGMENVDIHPTPLKEIEGLVLFKSMFGTQRVLGGSHPLLKCSDDMNSAVKITATSQMRNPRVMFHKHLDPGIDFFSSEEFGVKVPPNCERCRNCKNCEVSRNMLSREEQRELMVIENNLDLDPLQNVWFTSYPYKCDPSVLEDNMSQAVKIMMKTEQRLLKSENLAKKYEEQFQDFVKRGVFKEMTSQEMADYDGPIFYVSHHEVLKEDSASTPLRLVTNSSLKYKGLSVNDIWMKGPNTLNECYGVQLRFRCYPVGVVCDISKMYHRIKTRELERNIRRIVWRNLNSAADVKVFGIETVNFGDKPAAAISTIAVRKTAETYFDLNPEAAEKIINDSYVDDIATGVDRIEDVEPLKEAIQEILSKGGFPIKGFVSTGDVSKESLALLGTGDLGRVLGIGWEPERDIFKVRVRINFSRKSKQEKDLEYDEIPLLKEMKITRRLLLSVTNSCYDPLGLLAPVTVQMKIALRSLYNKDEKCGWDDDVSDNTKTEWVRILQRVVSAAKVTFKRCVKPPNAVGDPDLMICSDGSELAMCATAHVRWTCNDDSVICALWTAKSRVTPLRKQTIPRIEMQSAVLGVRLAESVKKHSKWKFGHIYHFVDSECTLATINRETTALKEFMGNRVSEILDTTTTDQWYHVRSKNNIADLGTRCNASITDISEDSSWQNGSPWMRLNKEEWPVKQDVGINHVPEDETFGIKMCAHLEIKEPIIPYESYKEKSYRFLINITAMVLNVVKNRSFRSGASITVKDLDDAELHMVKNSMNLTKVAMNKGKLESLGAEIGPDGIIRLGSRANEGLKNFYEKEEFPILLYEDPISYAWIKSVHEEDHSGVTRTVAKSRRKFWIVQARKIANKVKRSCYVCRRLDKTLSQQKMAPLPMSRQKMSPTFNEIAIDLFGPLEIRDTVKKRTKKKVWGIIISCLSTRAMHIDLSEDYSTDRVIQTLQRFIAIRGCPRSIFSDKGSQLQAQEFKVWALNNGIKTEFAPAEGQHQNGVSESLIKSIKRSLLHVIGDQILTFSGLQVVLYRVASIINARPIGIVSGSDPRQPTAITPNHLILGRSTPDVVTEKLDTSTNCNKRYAFLQNLVNQWWKQWYNTVLPSLVPSYKWRQKHRCVKPGDVCIIRYANELKANYRLGRVIDVKKGSDGLVRTVKLVYKNPNEKLYREVDRPVHGIAVIVPVEEQSQLNPVADEFDPSKKP